MSDCPDCQLPCLPDMAEGIIRFEKLPWLLQLKRFFARPWNYHIKKSLRKMQKRITTKKADEFTGASIMPNVAPEIHLIAGDWVRVRSKEEIQATLDNWNELRGCAFLANMWQYCGTTQQVLVSMNRFLDERDYKVKKCKGVILLKDVLCEGTPVFGRCDRRCHFFWREEWLEKILPQGSDMEANQ
jgi:hypothetical protein